LSPRPTNRTDSIEYRYFFPEALTTLILVVVSDLLPNSKLNGDSTIKIVKA